MELYEHLVEQNTSWQTWSTKTTASRRLALSGFSYFSLKHLAVEDLLHQHIHLLYFHFTAE